MPISSLTRRDTFRLLAATAPVLMIAATTKAGFVAESRAPAPGQSDQQFLQALVDGGGGTVRARSAPYRLIAPIHLPEGCALQFDAGVTILWDAPVYTGPRAVRGVLVIAGSNVTVGAPGAGVTIRASRSDPDLFGIMIAGHEKVTIYDVSTIECSHLFATASDGTPTSGRPPGEGKRSCRNIAVRGGGASFARLPADPWQAACTIQFTDGFLVSGSRYRNVSHGVQWWGGDAAPAADGAWGRERKCRNGRIENVTVDGAKGCSVWGSMGQTIRVTDCRGTNAGDVGFDAEGSIDVEFLRCVQHSAVRGCFSTFFFNRGIVFRDCIGTQPIATQPLFRIYTEVLNGNEDVSILGGRFECLGRDPGVIDDAYGDARSITIRGATLVNVTIVLHYREHTEVVIENNNLSFPGGASIAFDAVLVGVPVPRSSKAPVLRIRNNRIISRAGSSGPSTGIRVLRSAKQSTQAVVVTANVVTGFVRSLDVP